MTRVIVTVACSVNPSFFKGDMMSLVAPEHAGALTAPRPLRVALVVCGVATLFLGLFPSTLLSLVGAAASVNLL